MQDVTKQNQALSLLKDKGNGIGLRHPKMEDISEILIDLENRTTNLHHALKSALEDMEWMMENLSEYQELVSSQSDWQRNMWECLHNCTGFALLYLFYKYFSL